MAGEKYPIPLAGEICQLESFATIGAVVVGRPGQWLLASNTHQSEVREWALPSGESGSLPRNVTIGGIRPVRHGCLAQLWFLLAEQRPQRKSHAALGAAAVRQARKAVAAIGTLQPEVRD